MNLDKTLKELPDKGRILVGGLHGGLGVSYMAARLDRAARRAKFSFRVRDGGVFSLPLAACLPADLLAGTRRSAPHLVMLLVHPCDPASKIEEFANAFNQLFQPAPPPIQIITGNGPAQARRKQARLLAKIALQVLPADDPDHQAARIWLAAENRDDVTGQQGKGKI